MKFRPGGGVGGGGARGLGRDRGEDPLEIAELEFDIAAGVVLDLDAALGLERGTHRSGAVPRSEGIADRGQGSAKHLDHRVLQQGVVIVI